MSVQARVTRQGKSSVDEYGLTLQERIFCDNVLSLKSIIDSYYAAGFKPKNRAVASSLGSRMLKRGTISAYIAKKHQITNDKFQLTQEWVKEKLIQCVAQSLSPDELEKWDYDEKRKVGTGTFAYDSKGATTALKLLGETMEMFTKNLKVTAAMVVFNGDDEMPD